MEDNTANYISKFAPQSYFFTAPGALVQSAAQAFGPISENEYRITAKFDLPAGSAAVAICSGFVLIQPQTSNSDKVNLILRPFKQPIQGFNIKYFVYRGLAKNSFFDGDNVLPDTESTSDLIKKTNVGFRDYYQKFHPEEAVPPFLAKYLGFDPANQPDTLLMDDLFFKQSAVDEADGTESQSFELPLVQAGDTLGSFAGTDSGLDVVISYGDYRLPQPNDEFVFNLIYARAADWIINVSGESNAFKQKQIKERIFQFLDIAAYYGFHCNDGGWVKAKSSTAAQTKTGNEIYQDLLQGFVTKNRLYLYIQSDRTRSYNFYGNYTLEGTLNHCLKMGVTETELTERAFETLGWPLIIDEAAQVHEQARNTLFLQLVTDRSLNTMLWGQVALIENAQHDNFCGVQNLQSPSAANGSLGILTNKIILSNPAVGASNNKLNIAAFNIVLYQGKAYDYKTQGDLNESDDAKLQFALLSEAFDKLNAQPSFSITDSRAYYAVALQKVKLISQNKGQVQSGIAAAQINVVNDSLETGIDGLPILERVTYFTETIAVMNNAVSVNHRLAYDTKSSASNIGALESGKSFKFSDPYHYIIAKFTESGEVINGLKLESKDGSYPMKVVLGLTKAENNVIKALAVEADNSTLILQSLFPSGSDLISQENTIYKKYKAAVLVETSMSSLEVILPDEDIFIYSLDEQFYFSKEYAAYVKDTPVLKLILDTQIAL